MMRYAWVAAAAAICGQAQGALIPNYDLASLAWRSEHVVEATLASRAEDGRVEAKILAVFKGPLRPGDVVALADTSLFRVDLDRPFTYAQVPVGSRVFAFLQPRREDQTQPGHHVFVNGLALVDEGTVREFRQDMNPGPLVAQAARFTVATFRERVRSAVHEADETAKFLAANRAKADLDALIAFLARRAKAEGDDLLAREACVILANRGDLDALVRALAAVRGYRERSALRYGFGTPEGREFLLARVADASLPMAQRVAFAESLGSAGGHYRERWIDIEANGHRTRADAGDNGAYLVRVAKVALANRTSEELCDRLLHALDYFGRGMVQSRQPEALADLREAHAVLRELHAAATSVGHRFAIESALANVDVEELRRLGAPCGNMPSLIRAVDPTRYTKPAEPSLLFEYEFSAVLAAADAKIRPVLTLEHVATGERRHLPTTIEVLGGRAQGGSNSAVLPRDLPRGRYRAYLRVTDAADRVVSVGHGFLVDL